MFKALTGICLLAGTCCCQVTIPEGTKLRVRLEQTLTSATAEVGQPIELTVSDDVLVNSMVVIPQGATVNGTVTLAASKRRMGRAGHLDFSVDRVQAADGQYLPLRYLPMKRSGDSHALTAGLLTAGVAAVFWPAAPVFLLMHGKDVAVSKGTVYEVFTDQAHLMGAGTSRPQNNSARTVGNSAMQAQAGKDESAVTINSPVAGDEITVDAAFIGNTPTTVKLSAGAHHITVGQGPRQWDRTVQIGAGSEIYIIAQFPQTQQVAVR